MFITTEPQWELFYHNLWGAGVGEDGSLGIVMGTERAPKPHLFLSSQTTALMPSILLCSLQSEFVSGYLALSLPPAPLCRLIPASCISVTGPLAQPSQWPHEELPVSSEICPLLALHLHTQDGKSFFVSPHSVLCQSGAVTPLDCAFLEVSALSCPFFYDVIVWGTLPGT